MDYGACGAKSARVTSVNLGIGTVTCRQTNYGETWIKVDNDLSGRQALSALLI